MQAERTQKGTITSYASKISQLQDYLEAHHVDCLSGDNKDIIDIPIPTKPVMNFFGAVCKPAHTLNKLKGPEELSDDSPVPYSASHVRGFRSAIVDLYTSAKVKQITIRFG